MKIAVCFVVCSTVLLGSAFAQPFRSQISLGYGTSFGGYGVTYEYNFNKVLALQVGAGFYPQSTYPSSVIALKTYVLRADKGNPFVPFAEIEFGTLGQFTTQYLNFAGPNSTVSTEYTTEYGPSFLFGMEVYLLGRYFGVMGALGTSYDFAPSTTNHKISLAYDVGITIGL